MAVAHLEPARVRRYNPDALRGKPMERRVRAPKRGLVVGAILAGGMLQHVLATLPAEPQPAPLAIIIPAAAPPISAAVTSAPHVSVTPARSVAGLHALAPRSGAPAAHLVTRKPHAILPPRHGSPLLPPVGPAGDTFRIAIASNPQGAILHLPSVSVAAMRRALRSAGSPALGASYADHKDAAEYMWDAGRVLGVDPAVLMGIFRQESVFGTRGMAPSTFSVGNIRPLDGQPALNGYRLYRSWQEGIDDCYRLLRQYGRNGANSISLAIPVWAPPADNNDDSAYIASVLSTMNDLHAASAIP